MTSVLPARARPNKPAHNFRQSDFPFEMAKPWTGFDPFVNDGPLTSEVYPGWPRESNLTAAKISFFFEMAD
jgi:hypothetical protein